MKVYQRKAKIKRAKQHKKHCNSIEYQRSQSVKWDNDWKRYNEEYEQLEREQYADWNAENRISLKRLLIIVFVWVAVILVIAWIAEKFV